MQSGEIADEQISSSSDFTQSMSNAEHRKKYRAWAAREGKDGWISKGQGNDQWLQVDLLSKTKVTAIVTTGSRIMDNWPKKYKLRFSDDGSTFKEYDKVEEQTTI